MAQAQLTAVPRSNIKRYVPREKTGVYDADVEELIAANDQTGYQNTIEILVPSVEDVPKAKRLFNVSARAYGQSSRLVNGEHGVSQGPEGGRLLEFILVPRRTYRKRTDDTATDSDEPKDAA